MSQHTTTAPSSPHLSAAAAARRARRRSRELMFQGAGIFCLLLAAALLVWLMWGIVDKGRFGFTQNMIQLDVYLDPEPLERRDNESEGDLDGEEKYAKRLNKLNIYFDYITQAVSEKVPEVAALELSSRNYNKLFSTASASWIKEGLKDGSLTPGETITMWVLMDDVVDVYRKGLFSEDAIVAQRVYREDNITAMKILDEQGHLRERLYLGFPRLNFEIWLPFAGKLNWEITKGSPGFFTSPDSSNPEMVGIGRAFQGTLLMLLVVVVVAVPLGVAAAIYLEEFAPKNRFTDLIEININNLAAVPSIIFGVLGLGVLINLLFPFATGWPIIGGLVLSFMTLPTVIIASRAAILAVPSSYKEAAIGLGASKMQAVFQHVLPAATPGIASGVIIGIAQAAGETAPLIPIGMKSFIKASCEDGLACLFEQSTAMPAVIFFWAEHAERLFKFKANAAIIVLLAMILALNAIATLIRIRTERN